MVAQEYPQKQNGSTDLIVNNKSKQCNGLFKRNVLCSNSSVVILSTPFKEGVEVEL